MDGSVERNDGVSPTVLAARQANVSHHDDDPSSGNERTKTVSPGLIQFREKFIVVFDKTQLAGRAAVFFLGSVKPRSHNKMYAFQPYSLPATAGVPDGQVVL